MDTACRRTLFLMLAGLFFLPSVASAGMKMGVFIPSNREFRAAPAFGLDGRWRVTDKLKLGFETFYAHGVTGQDFLYGKGGFLSGQCHWEGSAFVCPPNEEVKSDLYLINVMVAAWYHLTENVYCGVGGGYFFTNPTQGVNDSDLQFSGPVDEPNGPAAQFVLGYMQSPVREHFLFFIEGKYLYQKGEGTLEVEKNRFEKYSDFSGFSLVAGITF